MAVRERARLGAVALGAGAAVLALIQILEQSVSAFSPRPIVSAMITIVVAMVGVTLARARSVSQRRQFLSNVLRRSPMPVAAEADPFMLGVLRPRTPADGGIGPYVTRSVDEPLRSALSKSEFVLLIGEARAGKSRTAYEALLRALPEQKLLIPFGGDALPSAIADPALRADEAVWWLDDLGRFLPKLDGPSLDELLNGDHLVVSSVRADTWDALLKADGDAGEQARTLLAGAHTIHMPAEHTPDELSEASRLYPDVDMSDGVGAALAADGAATREPIKPQAEAEPPRGFDPALGLLLIATVAASLFLAGLIVGGGFSDSTPPPIASQIEAIVGAGYRSGKQLVYYNLEADLHGLNQKSSIFVWRSPQGSDDLQIYDDDGGRLALRFEFPVGSTGKDPAQIVGHELRNVDGFFENELVGGYSTPKLWPAEVPFVVSWNEARRRYVLAPLLAKPVSSLLPKRTPVSTRPVELAPPLRRPVRLVYRSGATYTVKGFPVDLYHLVPAKGPTPAVLAVAAETTKKLHQLGIKTPAFALATFRLDPLVSTDDVPKLTCLHPALNPSPLKLVSLVGNTQDPFAPGSTTGPYGFQDSGTLGAGASGLGLLAGRVKAADAPCDVFAVVGAPSVVPAPKKKGSSR